jgi:hypothetical protein
MNLLANMTTWLSDSLHHHPFWFLVSMACVAWYSTVTVYVAIRGSTDIKHMLRHLESMKSSQDE